MDTVYLFALIFGLLPLLWFLFSGDGGGDGGIFFGFSPTAIVMGVTFFGAVGMSMRWLGVSAIVTLILAIIFGLSTAFATVFLFKWLVKSESSSLVPDHDIEGTVASVSVPVSPGNRGQIVLTVGDSRIKMTAKAIDHAQEVELGAKVIVVSVDSNIAVISPLSDELL